MIRTLERNELNTFTWIDVCEPSEDELTTLVKKYHLPKSIIADCLAPEHLPKIEHLQSSYFVIFRVFDAYSNEKALSIRRLSRKIAVLVTDTHLFTIHRAKLPSIDLMQQWITSNQLMVGSTDFMAQLCLRVIDTFQSQSHQIQDKIDHIEQKLFLSETQSHTQLKTLYRIKKQATLIKKINQLNKPIVDYISSNCTIAEYSQEIKDQYLNLDTITEELIDNTNNHVSLFLSVSAYRTNEVMRVLTVFSVFFMPLSFLAGVYGMNFSNMPELNTRYGYFILWAVFIAFTLVTLYWFRKKRWL